MLTPQQARNILGGLADDDSPNGDADPSPALHHQRDGRSLAPDGPAINVGRASSVRMPTHIGRYRILRLIAQGGMGAVYKGAQDHPHRRVAIKILKAAAFVHARTRESLDRFHNEVETLGRLEHPNIARLYDAGMHDEGLGGVPYFVMEYLPEASPITDSARDRRLSIRERLELFIAACDGVQHGHQRGIVHRDLKPSNILVSGEAAISPALEGGGQGVGAAHECDWPSMPNTTGSIHPLAPSLPSRGDRFPPSHDAAPTSSLRFSVSSSLPVCKIIDFGVARTTNADMTLVTQHTAAGHLIGTLQYMSPEQCDGDSRELDTRSDVYALGAVLYELLCERLPYDLSHMTIAGAAKIIQHDDPPAPHTWNRRLRGDLDAIILKAMHKNRDRRYGTAGELATDIRRHLSGEPIVARTPSRWMKATRWMARHPVVTTSVACALMLLATTLAIFGTVVWMNSQPAFFTTDIDDTFARLMSPTGRVLVTLGDGRPKSVICATMVQVQVNNRSRQMALIATLAGQINTNGELWLCEVNDLGNPVLTPDRVTAIPGLDLAPTAYDASSVFVGDVLADHAGLEIVATYQGLNHAPSFIHIYDLQLECLFEAWHWGQIRDSHFIPESRQLICVADMKGTAYTSNDREGEPPPIALFAIKPVSHQAPHWLDDGVTPGAHASVQWYRMLKPEAAGSLFDRSLRRPTELSWADSCVTLDLNCDEGAATLVIDSSGAIVSRSTSDAYERRIVEDGQRLPSLDTFALEQPPPLLPSRLDD